MKKIFAVIAAVCLLPSCGEMTSKTIDHVNHGMVYTTYYSTDGYHTAFGQDSHDTVTKGDTVTAVWEKN